MLVPDSEEERANVMKEVHHNLASHLNLPLHDQSFSMLIFHADFVEERCKRYCNLSSIPTN